MIITIMNYLHCTLFITFLWYLLLHDCIQYSNPFDMLVFMFVSLLFEHLSVTMMLSSKYISGTGLPLIIL